MGLPPKAVKLLTMIVLNATLEHDAFRPSPISLLSTMSKLLEKLTIDRLQPTVEQKLIYQPIADV